eukprot:TRINITY_DN28779_c1_g1_i3.p1 TRINITY_DN28779_c1_g1~~TRINITY_DN28779_c1_g1_i3.p1  ORF type:complete len:478 (-),score=47.90 TRINITY_DN28779_c1_g1_i3:79-1512(-)
MLECQPSYNGYCAFQEAAEFTRRGPFRQSTEGCEDPSKEAYTVSTEFETSTVADVGSNAREWENTRVLEVMAWPKREEPSSSDRTSCTTPSVASLAFQSAAQGKVLTSSSRKCGCQGDPRQQPVQPRETRRSVGTLTPEKLKFTGEVAGEGAFGEVRRGLYEDSIAVAVKVPRAKKRVNKGKASKKATTKTDVFCADVLANELRLLSRICHENVIGLVGRVVLDGVQCLVLEWAHGGNLTQYIEGRRRSPAYAQEWAARFTQAPYLPPSEHSPQLLMTEQSLLLDVAKGMRYLHSQTPRILHLDLKPDNILITCRRYPTAKVCDFGLGALLHSQSRGLSGKVGSNRYMAPEVEGSLRYGTAADVFSFGCVCFFVAVGMRLGFKPQPEDCCDCLSGCATPYFPAMVLAVSATCLLPEQSERACFSEVCPQLEAPALPLDSDFQIRSVEQLLAEAQDGKGAGGSITRQEGSCTRKLLSL